MKIKLSSGEAQAATSEQDDRRQRRETVRIEF
jgi:hypothetical protein